MTAETGGGVALIERFMPHFDARSRHAIEISAPDQTVFAAVETVTVVEVRFLRGLELLRALPGLVTAGQLAVPAADAPELLSFTPGAVWLGARPPGEVVAGAIGRFWRIGGNQPVVFHTAGEFVAFVEPGFAKAVVGFRLDRGDAGGVLLTTETRFVATDEGTRRSMDRYWRLIRPGSNLIRREWLRAIRRRAVRRPETPAEST